MRFVHSPPRTCLAALGYSANRKGREESVYPWQSGDDKLYPQSVGIMEVKLISILNRGIYGVRCYLLLCCQEIKAATPDLFATMGHRR